MRQFVRLHEGVSTEYLRAEGTLEHRRVLQGPRQRRVLSQMFPHVLFAGEPQGAELALEQDFGRGSGAVALAPLGGAGGVLGDDSLGVKLAAAAGAEDGQLRLFDLDEGVRVEVAREWLDPHKGFVALLASVPL